MSIEPEKLYQTVMDLKDFKQMPRKEIVTTKKVRKAIRRTLIADDERCFKVLREVLFGCSDYNPSVSCWRSGCIKKTAVEVVLKHDVSRELSSLDISKKKLFRLIKKELEDIGWEFQGVYIMGVSGHIPKSKDGKVVLGTGDGVLLMDYEKMSCRALIVLQAGRRL